MELCNNIINTAMIGTDKKSLGSNDLPVDLVEAGTTVLENNSIDKEEKFLQLASLAFNYRQCGVLPLHKEQITLLAAPAEEKEYCNNNALQVLKDIIDSENISLLQYWLQHCNEKNKIVQPEIVPSLLAIATQQKHLQTAIASSCGKRGEWLAKFNETWAFSTNQTAEELWQTGTIEQRKKIFKETRINDASQAREWLIQTWPQEDANTKIAFLEIFSIHISDDDISFLEGLSTDKSKKVKDEALQLLKQIPNSPIVKKYAEVLAQSVSIHKEKTLLGLGSKTSLQFHLQNPIDEIIFKNGIQKLSSTKDFTDDEFIIFQLIQAVSPTFWGNHLQTNIEETLFYFKKDEMGKKMIPALASSIARFKNKKWAKAFMEQSEDLYIELLPLLEVEQQEIYSHKFFDKQPTEIIHYHTSREDEWGFELTKNIMAYTSKNIYQYNRSFFNQQISRIPVAIISELANYAPKEEYLRSTWNNTSDHIIKLLELKSRTNQSFK